MSVIDLMSDLREHGIHLEAHGDRLRYSPRSSVTPNLAQRMKANKGELLAMLRRDTKARAIDLAAQLAALRTKGPAPAVPPPQQTTRLPSLPEPLLCELDHRNPSNWTYGPDRYGRAGFRRVTCKECRRFYGYVRPSEPPKCFGT
jgi:hypothetical protein